MRFLFAIILWLALATAPAVAQMPAPNPGQNPAPIQQPGDAKPGESSGGSNAISWIVAFLCTIVIMLIVCVPSRKSQS